MMYLRYSGEFLSIGGTVNRIEIWQENDIAWEVGELEFYSESPLTIEWSEKEKHDVIHGSCATLNIISQADRKYLDLYTVRYGDVRLDVYRDNVLTWSGCIDTEFYEEPYQYEKNYEVTLTFSDFGELDRIPFDMPVGFTKISDIVKEALRRTRCINSDMVLPAVSTKDSDGADVFSTGCVRTDNFYDEDGNAKSYGKVLFGLLQPLGIHMMQIRGYAYMYDYNTLSKLSGVEIYWTGDKQRLSMDKTYNNIEIKWSPYAQTDNMLSDSCWDDSLPISKSFLAMNQLDGKVNGDATVYTYPLSVDFLDVARENPQPGFSMWLSRRCKNIDTLVSRKYVFKTVPVFDGDESEGIAVYWRGYSCQAVQDGFVSYTDVSYHQHGYLPNGSPYQKNLVMMISTPHVVISPRSAEKPLMLRLKMDTLVDTRVNPYEDPKNAHNLQAENNTKYFNDNIHYMYVPVRICFKPAGSDDIWYYTNYVTLEQPFDVVGFEWTTGTWRKNDPESYTYLAYYDAENRRGSTCACKWATNRQAINPHNTPLTTLMTKIEDGQYITYPDVEGKGGEVWIEVMENGWWLSKASTHVMNSVEKAWDYVTWVLCKMPQLEIINGDLLDTDLETNDVIYRAEVNPDAKETLELNTICGSYSNSIPTARGAYFKEDGTQMSSFRRGDRVGPVEELLCGTLFSQYADRHICLSGECVIPSDPTIVYAEANQGDKKFVAMSEVQDIRMNTRECKYVELSKDEYDRR